MAKQYERKKHIINNSRDSERCNDLRKPLNSSERQKAKIDIKEQLENKGEFGDDWDWQVTDPQDWKYYTPISIYTTGGRFLITLLRFGILTGQPHNHYLLLEKLSSSKDGLII